MPPLVVWLIGAAGAVIGAKLWSMAEKKANQDLERTRSDENGEIAKLERDPATGTYRPRKQ
ncbi:MAG: hypothetical protein KGZ73_12030 [Rhizobiales bacterium]|jgi:hypothetical protein|nr:hypothetical protein [Hyphomicrobiales bacterium]